MFKSRFILFQSTGDSLDDEDAADKETKRNTSINEGTHLDGPDSPKQKVKSLVFDLIFTMF